MSMGHRTPNSPKGMNPVEYRAALGEVLNELSEAEFRDLTARIARKRAARAAAGQVRALIDVQVRPELVKLTRRVRRDAAAGRRFAAGRFRAAHSSAHD